ncbi:MAG TPA: NlpC/P60 family protein [Streptosporangiaceae bacterium]|nr:NlpC/P60 family protein [Streptosporangiaceae bacterium]
MHSSQSVRRVITRGAMIAASLATTAAVISLGGSAAAFPQPTIGEVQHEIAVLDHKASVLGQQYDQVIQDLSLANSRLKLLNRETKRYRANFEAMRSEVDRIAVVAYEQGGVDSPIGLLTSSTPQEVLNQSSILGELSAVDSAQITRYLNASRQLLTAQEQAKRTKMGILTLKHSLGKRLSKLKTLQGQEETLLAELTPVQRRVVTPGGGGNGGTGGTGGSNPKPPPVSGAAGKAVDFAYAQLGCPYVYGATGPCSSGFDCSGLMMSAWASAGVSIPRVSYDQIGSLPPVSLKDLQPGDILGFAGNSHVGMYVGGGYLIDAPTPGQNVEKVALSGWYAQELDAAVRP